MKRYHAIKLLLTLLIIASFFAKCKYGSESVNNLSKADSVNNCKSKKGRTPKGCPILPELQRINFYVETSASMGGYYNGETEFKTILSDLSVKMDKTIKPVSVFLLLIQLPNIINQWRIWEQTSPRHILQKAEAQNYIKFFQKLSRKQIQEMFQFLYRIAFYRFPIRW